MKKLLLITAFAISSIVTYSQATIVLNDSTRVSGIIKDSVGRYVDFIKTGESYPYSFKKKDIAYITNTDSLLASDKVNHVDLRIPPSQYFKQAGNFGIASVIMIIAGGVTGIVGGLKGNKPATYIGAGVSGAGFVFLIPAFTNLNKAGKVLKERDL